MRYIFPENAITELFKLRATYEKEKNVNLAAKPSLIGMPIILGGVNVAARSMQIDFLEKILKILGPNLKKFDGSETVEELKRKLEARRVAFKLCLVACWYIQSQTHTLANGSILSKIIDRCLQVTKENYCDEADKEECFLTVDRLVNTQNALQEANVKLGAAKLTGFTEAEWKQFTDFVKENQPKNKAEVAADQYPITSITKPLFGRVFANAGLAAGFLGGGVISQSSKAILPRWHLTAAIGGSILLMGPAGPSGLALFAPIIATKLFEGFCSITLANIMGKSMELLGKGLGSAVGMSLDLSCRLFRSFCSIVSNSLSPQLDNSKVAGLRIGDGTLMFCGFPISFTSDTALKTTKLKRIEFDAKGTILIDGKPLVNSKGELMLSADTTKKLKDQFTMDIQGVTGESDAPSAAVDEDEPAVATASPA